MLNQDTPSEGSSRGGVVAVVRDPSDEIAQATSVGWAISQLGTALAGRGSTLVLRDRLDQVPSGEPSVLVVGGGHARDVLDRHGLTLSTAPESLVLATVPIQDRTVTTVAGGDVRGLVYALLELADRINWADDPGQALTLPRPIAEQPANQIRSIARLFSSNVEDMSWYHDRAFWQEYLTELATHRFNRFNLTLGLGYNFPRGVSDVYFYFAYPFLIDVPGFSVRARGLADDERVRNLATLQFIGQEVKKRGLHFQLALWTHAYEWFDSPEANYLIDGLNPENHTAYSRAAVRMLLEQVPTVDGVTFRVHGESGIPEGSYGFWREVFAGVKECGRSVEIDMHPKGIDRETIDLALKTGLPTVISPKYWAEHQGLPYHQAQIRELEQVREPGAWEQSFMALSAGSRRFTRYGYADFLTDDRQYGVLYRIWPGTQRLLLWGDPRMAAGYGRYSHFAGCSGNELCEPLSFKGRMGSGLPGGRDGYADSSLKPDGGRTNADWQKYRYTYRVWGRLLYNPEHDPDGWRRFTRRSFGAAAPAMEEALANASRILLLITTAYHPSASNNRYWPEIYTNMPMAWREGETRPQPYRDTPSPQRFGTVSSLDPEIFSSIEEFAHETLDGVSSGRYSPLAVASWLDRLANVAEQSLAEARGRVLDKNAPEFRRWAVDVSVQSAIGRFYAGKLRAGVDYTFYKLTGQTKLLRSALDHYRQARTAWAEAAAHGAVYQQNLSFGREPWLSGHWADRLPAIDQDIADLAEELAASGAETSTSSDTPIETGAFLPDPAERPRVAHVPSSFRRGEPVRIALTLTDEESTAPVSIQLRYRHVNQAEHYQATEMERQREPNGSVHFGANIPGTYTDSGYALEYFFVLRTSPRDAWLQPGFDADLSNQPYYVIRPVEQSIC